MFDNELAFDKLLDSPGAETLLDSLVRALTADEQRENFDYIARCFDMTFPTAKARRERGDVSSPPLIFRAFGREPISHAHQSPLIIHVLLWRWNMSPRVADCLIPPHVIYYIYQANGLIYNPRSCNEHHRKTVRSPLCITDTCGRDSSPAHTQPKGQHQ